MTQYSEAQLKTFALPLSDTEKDACEHAINMISSALEGLGYSKKTPGVKPLFEDTFSYSTRMSNADGLDIKIFVQGSYANNTNVRGYSDVDIAVVREDVFIPRYRRKDESQYPQNGSDYGFVSAGKDPVSFKDLIESCLRRKFGNDVERKNKSIKVHGNTYRKDADTVPSKRYRDYRKDYLKDATNFIGGIVIDADDGDRIINYPEQHIENGRHKNVETNHQYKKVVRIFKAIRYKMQDAGISSAGIISSFGLESLLWNVPNEEFTRYTSHLGWTVEEVLKYLHKHKADIASYKEANGIKKLCEYSWNADDYKQFIDDFETHFDYKWTD